MNILVIYFSEAQQHIFYQKTFLKHLLQGIFFRNLTPVTRVRFL